MPTATPDAVEWMERLVGFDTTSVNTNLPLIGTIADFLDGHGIAVRLVHDDAGAKANLFATIGDDQPGGIVLSGHTDVVPVDGQPWNSDPFSVAERDDRFYGRGTADMKGFIGCVLAMVPELAARKPDTPVHLAFSYDEEVGCVGVRKLIELIGGELPTPKLVIVGEPTGMRVFDAHKGISQQTTVVTGRDGHSSRPRDGVNAVAFAAEIIGFLNRLDEENAGPDHADPRFDPQGTTFNVVTITGGAAVNIIARECTFKWEFRPTPATDPRAVLHRVDRFVESEILPRMRKVDPDSGVQTTVNITAPTLEGDADSVAVRFALGIAGANETGAASFVCEAGLFARAGIPSVVCGPGNIAQAHQPNEYVARSQIEACTVFLDRLADEVSA